MAKPAPDNRELDALLAALFDGPLAPGDRQRLAAILAGDPAAARLYADLTCMETLLRRMHEASSPLDEPTLRLIGKELESQATAENRLSDAMITRAIREEEIIDDDADMPTHVAVSIPPARKSLVMRVWSRFPARYRFAAAAAIILLLVGGVLLRIRTGGPVVATPVATLASATDARWDTEPVALHARLATGRVLRLRSGLVRVNFDSGATVVLDGPVDFEVGGANRVTLRHGLLFAHVPAQARGFEVRSTDLVVTDRGTEFGMNVLLGTSAEVHVFQGAVDVVPPSTGTGTAAAATHLASGEAVLAPVARGGGGTIKRIGFDRAAFGRLMLPALPTPGYDIGDVGLAGSDGYSDADAVYTVTGCGADIWRNADAFRFLSTSVTGDASVVARALSQTDTDEWAKAGVMIRSSAAPDAQFAEMIVSPRNGVSFQFRTRVGQDLNFPNPPDVATAAASVPVWLKLTRTSNKFAGYFSTDGVTWTQVGESQEIAMPETAMAGLAVTSKNVNVASTARFDGVAVYHSAK